MKENKLDVYIVQTADAHQSEEVRECDRRCVSCTSLKLGTFRIFSLIFYVFPPCTYEKSKNNQRINIITPPGADLYRISTDLLRRVSSLPILPLYLLMDDTTFKQLNNSVLTGNCRNAPQQTGCWLQQPITQVIPVLVQHQKTRCNHYMIHQNRHQIHQKWRY